jgi:hypothetical protein
MSRPTGVTVIGVLEIISGIGGLIGGICAGITLLISGVAAGIGAVGPTMSSIFEASGLVILATGAAFLVVFVGGLQFFVGVGLLALQSWAWHFARFVAVVAIIIGIVSLLLTLIYGRTDPSTGLFGPIVTIVLQGVILWYLVKPEVKQAFGVA